MLEVSPSSKNRNDHKLTGLQPFGPEARDAEAQVCRRADHRRTPRRRPPTRSARPCPQSPTARPSRVADEMSDDGVRHGGGSHRCGARDSSTHFGVLGLIAVAALLASTGSRSPPGPGEAATGPFASGYGVLPFSDVALPLDRLSDTESQRRASGRLGGRIDRHRAREHRSTSGRNAGASGRGVHRSRRSRGWLRRSWARRRALNRWDQR